ncbi:hypothetical protein U9M48_041295 [Paspalum notatum var. saurae]|uniref:Uncharacterized protein n=1 Tax=Paspalum notatum var. saurae TaxID=547442 RepID=A0AAQ3USC4_PASNO
MVAGIIVYGQSDSPYGDHFRKVRKKLVTVHLLNSKKVQLYRPAREEEVALVMAKLGKASCSPIKRSMIDMFEAGTDTSYLLVLEVAMAELMRKPHLMAKLQDEESYLKAVPVIKETLRLHPPAPLFIPSSPLHRHLRHRRRLHDPGRDTSHRQWLGDRQAQQATGTVQMIEFMLERFIMDDDAANSDDVDLKGCAQESTLQLPLSRYIMLANLVYRFDWDLSSKEDIDMHDGAQAVLRELLHLHLHENPRALCFILASLFSLSLLPLLIRRFFFSASSSPSTMSRDDDDRPLSRLPSPPHKLPVIGHLHLIGALPHVSLATLAAKHGPDLMLLRLGAVPTLVASSPRAAEAILRTHDHAFASRPQSMVAGIITYGQSDSCQAPYGDHFRKVRKLVAVHLLSSKKVRSFRAAREEEVGLAMAKLAGAAADQGAAAVVDMSELLQDFTNDLVCRAVSGKFSREEGRNKLFRELIATDAALLGGFNLEDYFPALARMELVSRVVCAKARRVSRRWDQLLHGLIDDHVARAAARRVDGDDGAVQEDDTDFIDVLLSLQHEYGLTRDHMKAILIDIFEAGTDTSYLVLEFAMAELMRKPHIMAKLQDEVRKSVPAISKQGQEIMVVTESDLATSDKTYLKAVIKETLRLHPPDDCDIDGYTIPAGTRTIVNVWAIGRLSSCWGDDADEFMPERFIAMDGGADDSDVDPKGGKDDFHYLPFGSGRRMCPGIHAGAAILEIMLANLVYRFDWELPPGMSKEDVDMTEVFGLTVRRKEKLFLVPKPRLIA